MRRRAVLRWIAISAGAAVVAASASSQSLRSLIGGVSERDAARGVREALSIAAGLATDRLGRPDGFFGDPRVRIPLPATLAQAQARLKPLGLSQPLDDLELRVNRGAEQAMPAAKKLFLDAVRGLTIADALGIVRGGEGAATAFLRQRTEPDLTSLLRPPMEKALAGAGAFAAAERVARQPLLQTALGDVRRSIVDFAVTKALDAAFLYVAEEERAIRQDPVRRTSDLLRRVFGQGR